MTYDLWNVHGITEDEYIEYSKCLEKLEDLGYEEYEVEKNILDCNNCILINRCDVSRENLFLGAKTC